MPLMVCLCVSCCLCILGFEPLNIWNLEFLQYSPFRPHKLYFLWYLYWCYMGIIFTNKYISTICTYTPICCIKMGKNKNWDLEMIKLFKSKCKTRPKAFVFQSSSSIISFMYRCIALFFFYQNNQDCWKCSSFSFPERQIPTLCHVFRRLAWHPLAPLFNAKNRLSINDRKVRKEVVGVGQKTEFHGRLVFVSLQTKNSTLINFSDINVTFVSK